VLKIPAGAEAAFQLVDTDAFGSSFSIPLYGAGRRGWFLARRRLSGQDADIGPQPLGKGQESAPAFPPPRRWMVQGPRRGATTL